MGGRKKSSDDYKREPIITVTCPLCNGTGTFPNSMHVCSMCDGKRKIQAIK